MNALPPIPTPLKQRLRPIRQDWVPVLVLLLVLVSIALIWRSIAQPTTFVGMVETVQTVVTSPDAGLLTNVLVAPLQEVREQSRVWTGYHCLDSFDHPDKGRRLRDASPDE